jgi:hypothetical protein
METRLTRGQQLAAFALLLGAAAYFVLVELHRPGLTPALDVYIYYLPNKLHAVHSVWQGGRGLLWNPYQSCGEPFFANPAMGLLYPPHLLFLVLEPNAAVHAVLILNMVIGGVGMLLLTRELGLGWVAALGGAVVFELGDPMAQLTGWSPMQNGPWAWVPWALLLCERLLKEPTRRRVVALAVVLALELLPGWVLITALTYQLIALRVAWELLTGARPRPWRSALAIGAALALAAGLAAVQLIPAAEFAGLSSRVALEAQEFLKSRASMTDILTSVKSRIPPVPFMVAPLLLATVAVFASSHRRMVGFFLLAGGLYGVLALGQTTPLFGLYAKLPPGASTIRYSTRLFWITGFSLAMLAAFGLDALQRVAGRAARRWLAAVAALAVGAAVYVLTPGGLRWEETVAVALVVAAVLTAAARPSWGRPAGYIAGAALALNLVAVPLHYGGQLMPTVDSYWRHADTFAGLDPPLTAQDRIYIVSAIPSMLDFSLLRKTATLLRVPDIFDYDALMEFRHAEYSVMMWHGATITSMEDFTNMPTRGKGFQRRLLDLAAVRDVITSPSANLNHLELPAVPAGTPDLRVYRNDSALPRARYVPRVEVIADPDALLNRLAFGADDLSQVAFVEASPPSGFTGDAAAAAKGTARFVTNDPEHLVIDVDAPARGFLVLADEFYPGWQATVNGAPVPLLRANYTYRLIEVPAGTSRVEFRYRPASVAVGAAISVLTLAMLALLFWRKRVRPQTRD